MIFGTKGSNNVYLCIDKTSNILHNFRESFQQFLKKYRYRFISKRGEQIKEEFYFPPFQLKQTNRVVLPIKLPHKHKAD
jgi:thermostable 8-oxoguanine DNA glycosylase